MDVNFMNQIERVIGNTVSYSNNNVISQESSTTSVRNGLSTLSNRAFVTNTTDNTNTNVEEPKSIAKKTLNPDGTYTLKYVNGVTETLAKNGTGQVNYPNGLSLNILETDEKGKPTNMKVFYKGKELNVTADEFMNFLIRIKDIDGKGTDVEIKDSSWMRDKDLSPEEKKGVPEQSYGTATYNYTDPNNKYVRYNQKIAPDGTMEITGGNELFRGGQTIIDTRLQKGGGISLNGYNDFYEPPAVKSKVTVNEGNPYDVELKKRYFYRNNLEKEITQPDTKKVYTGNYDARWVETKKDVWENNKKYNIQTECQASVPAYITVEQIQKL